MCGRYVLKDPIEELERQFGFHSFSEIRLVPRFNIPPTTQVPIILATDTGRRSLENAKWGLVPPWAKPDAKLPLLINARAEGVATKPAFRHAFKKNRCLVPASGYFEWQKLQSGGKQPFYILRTDGEPLAFAGLWEAQRKPDSESILTTAIVTTAASPELAVIHDRMPVVLPESAWDLWLSQGELSPNEADSLLAPAVPYPLERRPVSTRVNSIKNIGEDLIQFHAPGPERDLFGP